MKTAQQYLEEYLEFNQNHKRLDKKTIKAYRIDLTQLLEAVDVNEDKSLFGEYITRMHNQYKPKTVKRKIASYKAFFRFLEEKEYLQEDLNALMKVKFREPKLLPKTISLHNLQLLFDGVYQIKEVACDKKKEYMIRDIAILELLLATGIRISELCQLKREQIDLASGVVRIYGKGSKERMLSISNEQVRNALEEYETIWFSKYQKEELYFLNNFGRGLSDQSVRTMIRKYTKEVGINQHITPHMFRHSFATLLLDQDVDIRHIQKMLGHSSINITAIYTYVSNEKQKEILIQKNPRNLILS